MLPREGLRNANGQLRIFEGERAYAGEWFGLMAMELGQGGMRMLCGPKGSEEPSSLQCGVCGRRTELFELPGRSEKYCLECSADVATSMLLTTEIDAATLAGRETQGLVAEFAELSHRILERSQSERA